MLKRNLYWRLVALVFVMDPLIASAAPNWLITPEEAARISPPADNLREPASAVQGPGPQIIVKNPRALSHITSPVNILVAFRPGKSGLSPDMKTLTVTLIGLFDIDITDRLSKYISRNNLEVNKADLPPGRHRLRMAIKDVKGNPNERDVVIVVTRNGK